MPGDVFLGCSTLGQLLSSAQWLSQSVGRLALVIKTGSLCVDYTSTIETATGLIDRYDEGLIGGLNIYVCLQRASPTRAKLEAKASSLALGCEAACIVIPCLLGRSVTKKEAVRVAACLL